MATSRILAAALLLAMLTCVPADAETFSGEFTVAAGEHDRVNTPVVFQLQLPKELAQKTLALTDEQGRKLVGQLTAPGLLAPPYKQGLVAGCVVRELHFILPELKAGESAKFTAEVAPDAATQAEAFAWHDTPGESTELRFGERPALKYMYRAFDDSTKENRDETYKVFHHLYDPAGKQLVTKGSGGEYPHHRGIFYGFNNVSYEGVAKADLWHCQGEHYQDHAKFVEAEAGPVLGRQRLEIHWHGGGKKTFAKELRELTVYNVPSGQLVEFASRLESVVGDVKLDGDPQHAGFQFRAAQEVAAKTKKQTYYVRPDGTGQPGETRNWPADKDQVNLPWKGMSFVVGEQRYTAAYLDRPENPKESRFSERDYGRFGSYFVYELKPDRPLDLSYRLWLQAGEMTGNDIARVATDFVAPPQIEGKWNITP